MLAKIVDGCTRGWHAESCHPMGSDDYGNQLTRRCWPSGRRDRGPEKLEPEGEQSAGWTRSPWVSVVVELELVLSQELPVVCLEHCVLARDLLIGAS